MKSGYVIERYRNEVNQLFDRHSEADAIRTLVVDDETNEMFAGTNTGEVLAWKLSKPQVVRRLPLDGNGSGSLNPVPDEVQ